MENGEKSENAKIIEKDRCETVKEKVKGEKRKIDEKSRKKCHQMSEKSLSLIERQVQSFEKNFETTPIPNSKGCRQVKEKTIKPSIIRKIVPKNAIKSENKSPERKFRTSQNSEGKAYQKYSEAKNLKNKERFLSEKSGQSVKKIGNIFEGGEAIRGQAKIEDLEWEKSKVEKKDL